MMFSRASSCLAMTATCQTGWCSPDVVSAVWAAVLLVATVVAVGRGADGCRRTCCPTSSRTARMGSPTVTPVNDRLEAAVAEVGVPLRGRHTVHGAVNAFSLEFLAHQLNVGVVVRVGRRVFDREGDLLTTLRVEAGGVLGVPVSRQE